MTSWNFVSKFFTLVTEGGTLLMLYENMFFKLVPCVNFGHIGRLSV